MKPLKTYILNRFAIKSIENNFPFKQTMLWMPKRRFIRRCGNTMSSMLRNITINVLVGSVLPSTFYLLYLCNIVTLSTFKIFVFIFIVVFVIFPLIYKNSYKLQSSAVFLNFVHVSPDADYQHPEKYGLDGAINFYLITDDKIRLGVWHILPENIKDLSNDNQSYENALGNGQDVVIYYHGNAGTRLTNHRVELYKVLRKHFHVITFDYRSYADSSNVDPSEDKLVKDGMFVYEWVVNRTRGHLFIWGHSLGTSLAIHSLSNLQQRGLKPNGVFLEAPFNNMKEEISEFPLSRLFRSLPWFSYTVTEPMQENGFKFETDRYICDVDAPIIILHAEDDHVVPFRLGYKLYKEASKCRKESQGSLTFYKFKGKDKYEHKYICRAPEIHDIIHTFVSNAVTGGEKRL